MKFLDSIPTCVRVSVFVDFLKKQQIEFVVKSEKDNWQKLLCNSKIRNPEFRNSQLRFAIRNKLWLKLQFIR